MSCRVSRDVNHWLLTYLLSLSLLDFRVEYDARLCFRLFLFHGCVAVPVASVHQERSLLTVPAGLGYLGHQTFGAFLSLKTAIPVYLDRTK